MKGINRILMIGCVLLIITSIAWAGYQESGLSVGEKCPDFTFDIINKVPRHSTNLSGIKSKLIILDFWASWCMPCIKSIANLDSLQRIYGDKLTIILINTENQKKALDFFRSNKVGKGINLPCTIENLKLMKAFPHKIIPHVIWIGGNREIKGITGSEEVNSDNIRQIVSGKEVSLVQKAEIMDEYDTKNDLLTQLSKNNQIYKTNLLNSSTISGQIKGLPSFQDLNFVIVDKVIKFTAINFIIQNLYEKAFVGNYIPSNPDFYLSMPSRMILHVKDSSRFYWNAMTNARWKMTPDENKEFCYELIRPISDSNRFFINMQKDLNAIFGNLYGINAHLEKHKINCWSLVQKSGAGELPISKGRKPEFTYSNENGHMINMTISDFMFELVFFKLHNSEIPLIDESGITEPIDLNFTNTDLSNINSVRQLLNQHGLDFIKVERDLTMIVITDQIPYLDN